MSGWLRARRDSAGNVSLLLVVALLLTAELAPAFADDPRADASSGGTYRRALPAPPPPPAPPRVTPNP